MVRRTEMHPPAADGRRSREVKAADFVGAAWESSQLSNDVVAEPLILNASAPRLVLWQASFARHNLENFFSAEFLFCFVALLPSDDFVRDEVLCGDFAWGLCFVLYFLGRLRCGMMARRAACRL